MQTATLPVEHTATPTSRFSTVLILALCAAVLGWLYPSLALAHVSSQVFTMLLPTDLYVAGGVITLAATVAWLLLAGHTFGRVFGTGVALWRSAATPPHVRHRRAFIRSVTAAVLWTTLILIGLFGPHGPRDNLLPVFVWEVFWPCALLLAAIWTGFGKWLDPWSAAQLLARRFGLPPAPLHLARRWRGVPACASAIAVALFMLADLSPNDPQRLALHALAYWGCHLICTLLFGKRWLLYGEAFGLTFALIARLRCVERRGHRLHVQLPGRALIQRRAPATGHGLLVLTTLAIGSFDSLNETFWWLAQLKINPLLVPGRSALAASNAVAIVLSPGLVAVLFSALVFAGAAWARLPLTRATWSQVALTCLPIAWGYHLAHYSSVALVGYQYLLVGISDPFGTGLNWLGLDKHFVSTGFFFTPGTARRLFELQTAAVVLGHMLSLLMAHAVAAQWAGDRARVNRASLPLAVFMVFFTLFGLWLLASPKA